MSPEEEPHSISRRRLLAASSAVALGATSGCVQRVRSILNRRSPSTASVTILSPPTDVDGIATNIANAYAENMQELGIDAEVEFLPYVEFYRRVLLNREFDMFVGRLPRLDDPDDLRTLLHSQFGEEPGWQNPYGFANLTIDEELDEQKQLTGTERESFVSSMLGNIVREQPFVTVGYLHGIRAVGETGLIGWERYDSRSPLNYIALETEDVVPPGETITLKVGKVDPRITQNLNPLSVEYRDQEPYLGLIYDPIAFAVDDQFIPWLARDISWSSDADATSATVELREGLVWHDEEPIVASDISFTYEFLADTTRGEEEVSAPAPRFRGRSSLVEDVSVLDELRVQVSFGNVGQKAAARAFTVPVLPEHVWSERTEPASISGVDSGEGVTEALVWENEEPVGSGPLKVEDVEPGEWLDMVRFEDHFIHRIGSGELDVSDEEWDWLGGGTAFDRLEIKVSPSNETVVEAVSAGEVDVTSASIPPGVVPQIGEASDVTLFVDSETTSRTYHVGLNGRTEPLSNPNFRRLVARLIDKTDVVENIFDGYGEPISNPLARTSWNPEELEYEDEDPELPFLGNDGEVDVSAARDVFREQGYEFNEDGELIVR